MDLPIASIDVGSGMTKFVIAILRRSAHNNRSIQVIEKIEKPIPYGVYWKSSNDGFLSQEIQNYFMISEDPLIRGKMKTAQNIMALMLSELEQKCFERLKMDRIS